eukprot:TRINITY_DN378_c0_g1_i1.p1 TRINITY_DN378_c0_g1~~TRINITY_DN378_c0_g1_i1.p1  ORF type:complete len:126 (+),score=22.00 TRINITY_DN378_c0_g1_i1:54-431(+)
MCIRDSSKHICPKKTHNNNRDTFPSPLSQMQSHPNNLWTSHMQYGVEMMPPSPTQWPTLNQVYRPNNPSHSSINNHQNQIRNQVDYMKIIPHPQPEERRVLRWCDFNFPASSFFTDAIGNPRISV